MTTEDDIRLELENIGGIAAVEKATVVASRAALLKDAEPDIDLSSLIVGLHIGAEDEMPQSMPVTILGLTNALAIVHLRNMSGEQPRP